MKISARNVLPGVITQVTPGAVNGIVVIDIDGTVIKADITNDAIESLGLEVGKPACAIIKATNVMIATGSESLTNLSARNQIHGVISDVVTGAVNGHVILNTGCCTIKSSITNDAIASLGLEPNMDAIAIIKATDVLVGVE